MADVDRMRGTGGNRFIEPDATRGDLLKSINDQLGDLHEWATDTDRVLDLAEITISTQRIPSGRISVTVTADLARPCGGCGLLPDACKQSQVKCCPDCTHKVRRG